MGLVESRRMADSPTVLIADGRLPTTVDGVGTVPFRLHGRVHVTPKVHFRYIALGPTEVEGHGCLNFPWHLATLHVTRRTANEAFVFVVGGKSLLRHALPISHYGSHSVSHTPPIRFRSNG